MKWCNQFKHYRILPSSALKFNGAKIVWISHLERSNASDACSCKTSCVATISEQTQPTFPNVAAPVVQKLSTCHENRSKPL